MWQDNLITIVNLTMVYGMLMQVVKGFKDKKRHINFQTGLITFIGLYATAIAFFSLNLIFSAVTVVISGTLWLILFIQTIVYKK
ncbi:MAG TPA: hypothetical protein PLK34_01895 [Candidatus Pacearchaeota archaeon]|nr:hypothetical protein [Candidatus Pacearchaeota archaeon]